MTLLKDHYATKPEIKPLLRPLGSSNDEIAENLIREVMAKNPDRKIQALACKSLADGPRQHRRDGRTDQSKCRAAPELRVGSRQDLRRQAACRHADERQERGRGAEEDAP